MRLFGTDGIRGRAGEGPLAPERVRRLGKVIGHLLKRRPALFRTPIPRRYTTLRRRVTADNIAGKGRVIVGRDPRESGPAIEEALIEGLRTFGIDVRRAGVLPTPGVAHLTRKWSCPLGVVISASHNPAADNGIKLISNEGLKIADEAEAAIEALAADEGFDPKIRRGGTAKILAAEAHAKAGEEYVEDLLAAAEPPPLDGMKIALDCANGATSEFAPALLTRLGATVAAIHASPDGRNINAGCGAVHPEVVAAHVKATGAALGVAFDGDGDRAMFVDAGGVVRDGDDVLLLAARWMRKRRGLTEDLVVGTGMTNYGLELALRKEGIALVRAAVGDRFVAEELMKRGGVLGGEPSGHIINFHHASTGDGMLTMLTVLRILREGGVLGEGWTRLPQLIDNVRVRGKPPLETLAGVPEAIAQVERALDGRGRVIVRYSGTEPLCRVMVEGPDGAEVKKLARLIRDAVEQQIGDQTVRQH